MNTPWRRGDPDSKVKSREDRRSSAIARAAEELEIAGADVSAILEWAGAERRGRSYVLCVCAVETLHHEIPAIHPILPVQEALNRRPRYGSH